MKTEIHCPNPHSRSSISLYLLFPLVIVHSHNIAHTRPTHTRNDDAIQTVCSLIGSGQRKKVDEKVSLTVLT